MHSKLLFVLGLCAATMIVHSADANVGPTHRHLSWNKDHHRHKHGEHDYPNKHKHRHDHNGPSYYRRRLGDAKTNAAVESSDYEHGYDDYRRKDYKDVYGYDDKDYDNKDHRSYDEYKGYGGGYGDDCDDYGYGKDFYGGYGIGDYGYGGYGDYGFGGSDGYYPSSFSSYGGFGYYPYGGGYGYGYGYTPYFGYESASTTGGAKSVSGST